MKKWMFILLLWAVVLSAFAQLDFNIPFDLNVVGPAWDGENYNFQSDDFFATNLGATSEFTITVTSFDLPENWNLMWCNELDGQGGCNMVPSITVDFPHGAEMKFDFILAPVTSAESCHIQFLFESDSLPEPETVVFFFRTEDASSTDDMNLAQPAVQLFQNYPNPFNPTTTIRFSLPDASSVTLSIFNISGQKVTTLTEFDAAAGIHEVQWNGNDAFGKKVASGTYFYRLSTDNNIIHKKMILMK